MPRATAGVRVRYEQAVYGSFPFWEKGYAFLARSPGCRDEWLADLRLACQGYGERPAGAAEAGGLFARKLPSGPWAVVRPSPQGLDDRGRPGAVAFHALFLSGADYRRAGASPFGLASLLRGDWTADDLALPAGLATIAPDRHEPGSAPSPRAARIADALARGRRVALESPGPIDALAREAWRALPPKRRARLSLSTWSFANTGRFDLVALPRLAGVALDPSYVDPDLPPPPRPVPTISPLARLAWAGFALAALLPLGIAWSTRDRSTSSDATAAALLDFARRFDPAASAAVEPLDATLRRLRERLTYSGPLLTADEVARIAASADPDRSQALARHAQVLLFLPDRPLPADFAAEPPDRQARALAASFHLDAAGLSPGSIPALLSRSLGRDGPVAPLPLAGRYPALAEYDRFLRSLPAR